MCARTSCLIQRSMDKGGTGISFDWAIINELNIPLPYFLSGGLSHDTVIQPWNYFQGTSTSY